MVRVTRTIRDTGTVAKQLIDELTTKLRQTPDRAEQRVIAKKIVEEHHGRVTVENRPQNGALVTLYFPLEGITN